MGKEVTTENEKIKVVLDWKAPSEKKMAEYVKDLGNESMKSFAKACVEKKDNKNVINKSKAKKWLVDNCDSKGDIEWKNRPQKVRPISGADEIASWLDI